MCAFEVVRSAFHIFHESNRKGFLSEDGSRRSIRMIQSYFLNKTVEMKKKQKKKKLIIKLHGFCLSSEKLLFLIQIKIVGTNEGPHLWPKLLPFWCLCTVRHKQLVTILTPRQIKYHRYVLKNVMNILNFDAIMWISVIKPQPSPF